MKLKPRQTRILLLLGLFTGCTLIATGTVPLSVIQSEATLLGTSFAVSDMLTLIALMGSLCSVIALFTLTKGKRGE